MAALSESSESERKRTFLNRCGKILPYLQNPDFINLDLTSDDLVIVERYGFEEEEAPVRFSLTDRSNLANALATYSRRKGLSRDNSQLACDLPAGFILSGDVPVRGRVQAFYEPIAPGIPIVIRKHATRVFPLDAWGMTRTQLGFIRWAVEQEKNILTSGGQNAAKSTFMNSLIREQGIVHRLGRSIILQDRDELQKCARNSEVLFYDVEQTKYVDGKPVEYLLRLPDLLPATLRLRVRFLAIGESREGVTLEALIVAANTGTGGLYTTIHANSAHDVFDRIAEMLKMAGKKPVRRAINRLAEVVVHMEIDKVTRHRRVREILHTQCLESGEFTTTAIA